MQETHMAFSGEAAPLVLPGYDADVPVGGPPEEASVYPDEANPPHLDDWEHQLADGMTEREVFQGDLSSVDVGRLTERGPKMRPL